MNISHQSKITCVNSQHEGTNSKGDFVLINRGFKIWKEKTLLDFYKEIILFELIGLKFLL